MRRFGPLQRKPHLLPALLGVLGPLGVIACHDQDTGTKALSFSTAQYLSNIGRGAARYDLEMI